MNRENRLETTRSNTAKSSGLLSATRQDFLASIVVFLVALPLCMGIAIASGVPVAAGLITGIVGGLIVGWFSGAPLQVSGPAAGLTVIWNVSPRHVHAALRPSPRRMAAIDTSSVRVTRDRIAVASLASSAASDSTSISNETSCASIAPRRRSRHP